jgi:hypothetical protein
MPKPKRHFDAVFDARVSCAYDEFLGANDRTALTRAAEELGVPRWVVSRRGKDLGLSRIKEKPWSAEELSLLREWRHYGINEISRRFRERGIARSPFAVLLKRRRLNLTTRNTEDGFSAHRLAGFLRIDSHRVSAWIHVGLLRAEMRQTTRVQAQGGDGYWIRRDDFRAFVQAYPEQIDVRKVDPLWFIPLLLGSDGAVSPRVEDEEYFTCP